MQAYGAAYTLQEFLTVKSDDVAAVYAFYQPTQGPFNIVPSMAKEEFQSDFTLSSK